MPTPATCTNAKGSAQVNSFDASINYTLEQAGVTKYTAIITGLFQIQATMFCWVTKFCKIQVR